MRYPRYNPFSSREGVNLRRVFGSVAAVALAATLASSCREPFEPDCSTYLSPDGTVHTIKSDQLPGKQMSAFAVNSYDPEGIKITFQGKDAVLTDEKPNTVYNIGPNVVISFTKVEAPKIDYVAAKCVETKQA